MPVNLDLPTADENIRPLGAPCWGCLRTHQVLRRPSLHRPLQIPRTWKRECSESLKFPEENPGAQGPRILSLKPSKEAEMKPSLGMPRLCLPCSFLGLRDSSHLGSLWFQTSLPGEICPGQRPLTFACALPRCPWRCQTPVLHSKPPMPDEYCQCSEHFLTFVGSFPVCPIQPYRHFMVIVLPLRRPIQEH